MIMFGTNITSPADKLSKVSEEYLFHSLRNPKLDMAAMIRQLRLVCQIDPRRYATLKRQLPYIVCGTFNPPYRKTDNFAYTETFILDVDKLSAKGLSLTAVRSELQSDTRVMMCFASPSGDGLKVMLRLKERCHDAGLYSIFYKAFLSHFSARHHLEQVVDSVTSDVARACFLSVDPEAYFNPEAEPVDITIFVDIASPTALFDMKRQQDKETKENDRIARKERKELGLAEPDDSIMERIKQQINPSRRAAKEKTPAYVPQRLEEVIGDIVDYIAQTGLVVQNVTSIQYGKKVNVSMGLKQAEVNVFYGKRGFSVVKSPKCGTDAELGQIVAELVSTYIDTH